MIDAVLGFALLFSLLVGMPLVIWKVTNFILDEIERTGQAPGFRERLAPIRAGYCRQ